MSGYTSGKTHSDPEPWRSRTTFERYPDADAAPEVVKTWGMDYDPRPEFDRHSPILQAFRNDMRVVKMDGPSAAESWIGGDAIDVFEDMYDAAVLDHARRVLAKLAALTTTPNGVTD